MGPCPTLMAGSSRAKTQYLKVCSITITSWKIRSLCLRLSSWDQTLPSLLNLSIPGPGHCPSLNKSQKLLGAARAKSFSARASQNLRRVLQDNCQTKSLCLPFYDSTLHAESESIPSCPASKSPSKTRCPRSSRGTPSPGWPTALLELRSSSHPKTSKLPCPPLTGGRPRPRSRVPDELFLAVVPKYLLRLARRYDGETWLGSRSSTRAADRESRGRALLDPLTTMTQTEASWKMRPE